MKLSLFGLMAGLVTSSVSFATPISKCVSHVYDKNNGALLSGNISYIRQGRADLVQFGNSKSRFSSLRLTLSEERNSPDTTEFAITASDLPANTFFNDQAGLLGGTFGDAAVFGSVDCELPTEKEFYYKAASGKILLDDKTTQSVESELYSTVLTQNVQGACIGGNLSKAAIDLNRYWYLPIENIAITGAGIRFMEVKKKCVKSVPEPDLPSGVQCLKFEETSRRSIKIDRCLE
jgi:hypothetical protein